ncbi:MAG: ChbG/HpnK family deacetylase [[Ruminococcus] gnavus]|nr:ChbG/HpnK family deacetylase [Mediterraneibacter gnavus]
MIVIRINADDFGLNSSCTKAICEAFEKKLITDTTIVANGSAFDEAVEAIKQYNMDKKIGIHFNLTEGIPLTSKIKDCDSFVKAGLYHGKISRNRWLNKKEKEAIYEELMAQATKLKAAGIDITHADSHHHIHTCVCIAPIVKRVCKEQGIKKIRLHRNIGSISFVKRVVKKIYNMWLKLNGFKTLKYFGSMEDVENIGVKDQLEIMVHPEYNKNGQLIDKTDNKNGRAIGKILKRPQGNYRLKGYSDL